MDHGKDFVHCELFVSLIVKYFPVLKHSHAGKEIPESCLCTSECWLFSLYTEIAESTLWGKHFLT